MRELFWDDWSMKFEWITTGTHKKGKMVFYFRHFEIERWFDQKSGVRLTRRIYFVISRFYLLESKMFLPPVSDGIGRSFFSHTSRQIQSIQEDNHVFDFLDEVLQFGYTLFIWLFIIPKQTKPLLHIKIQYLGKSLNQKLQELNK